MKLIQEDYIHDNLLPHFTPYYIYSIYELDKQVGTLVFRLGNDTEHYYDGHIAYTIDEEFRGHSYAYKACLLLKEEIKKHGYNHVLITCDPHNMPSKKTIQKLGCTYIETKPVPRELKKVFNADERIKEIYRWELI